MKHAGEAALAAIGPVLKALRKVEGLAERRPGVFYRKSRAFIHFHEDPAGIFADVRIDGEWQAASKHRSRAAATGAAGVELNLPPDRFQSGSKHAISCSNHRSPTTGGKEYGRLRVAWREVL